MSNKECTACKTTKPESEFYFNTRAGCLKSICKNCEKATVMEWKRNNKDKVKDSNARYYQKINKDKVKEYSTRYYQKLKTRNTTRNMLRKTGIRKMLIGESITGLILNITPKGM